MTVKVWSLDDGFGDLKGFNGKDSYIIPSYVTKWQPIPESDLARQEFSEPESHITVEFDGRKTLIGRGAQLMDKRGIWDGQENKHLSKKFPPLLKGMLGILAKDETEKEITVDPLVMGLPVEQETEKRKKDLAGIVKGTHEVKVTLADGTVIEKTVTVKSVVIKSQPFGTWSYKALDNQGNIKDELVQQQYSVVFDLGARTLNVLTLRGFTPIPNLCFTEPMGVYSAWESLQEDIKTHHAKDLPLARIPYYAEQGYVSGNVDIRSLRDENYTDHVDELVTLFMTKFAHNYHEIDNLIITGGGAEVLGKWLQIELQKRVPQAKIEMFGRLTTAQGYYNFGVRTARTSATKKTRKQVAASKEEN